MISLRSLPLFLILLGVLAIISTASDPNQKSHGDPAKFQAMLSSVSDAEIHEVLSKHDSRFRKGVFDHDRTAIEAVHSEDPATATELVELAKKMKNKRQVSNSTITSSIPPPPPPTSRGSTTQNNPPSTSNSRIRTSVIPPSSPTGASVVSSTSGGVVFSQSNGKLTTARSSTALVSFKPSTTTLLLTSTLPDGRASTITSVAVVDAAYTTMPTAEAAASATDQPSLQTGGTTSSKSSLSGAMIALAAVAAFALAL